MPATISFYSPADQDQVWALHCKTVRENAGFVKNLSFHSDLHDIPNVYEAWFVLREEDGPVIGMTGLKRVAPETLKLKRLEVDSAHQGKGYGRALLNRAIDYARETGTATLELDVSAPQAKARALYLGSGFTVIRTAVETFGPDNEAFDMTYMAKTLPTPDQACRYPSGGRFTL